MAKVTQCLKGGDQPAAYRALADVEKLARATEPPLISDDEIAQIRVMIETIPKAALHCFKHASANPFAVLGMERLRHARSLNTANRRALLKSYRKLAMELHPDRCAHALAVEAMQLLNACYDKAVKK